MAIRLKSSLTPVLVGTRSSASGADAEGKGGTGVEQIAVRVEVE